MKIGIRGKLEEYEVEGELWSGKTDKLGKKIYEGDIVEYENLLGKPIIGWVEWRSSSSSFQIKGIPKVSMYHCKSLRVIGNKYKDDSILKEVEREKTNRKNELARSRRKIGGRVL